MDTTLAKYMERRTLRTRLAEHGLELTPDELDMHVELIAAKFRQLMPEETEGLTDDQVIDFIIANVNTTS